MKFLKKLISIYLPCFFRHVFLIVIVNFEINSIYNSNATLAGFLIEGEKLASGQVFVTKINETTFDAIKQGEYFIRGRCGNVNNWTIKGNQLEEKFIENNSEWKITIIIDRCNTWAL